MGAACASGHDARHDELEALVLKLEKNITASEVVLSHRGLKDVDVVRVMRALSGNRSCEALDVSANEVGDATAVASADMLRANVCLRRLCLGRNGLTAAGFSALCEALETNFTLQVLDVYGCAIGPEGGLKAAQMLRVNKALLTLDCYGAALGDIGARSVFASLMDGNTTLQSLSMYGNGVGPASAAWLRDMIDRNRTLRNLNLKANRLGDDGAREIAFALQRNPTLRRLNLARNGISAAGVRVLREALDVNHSLTELVLIGNDVDSDSDDMAAIRKALERNKGMDDEADELAATQLVRHDSTGSGVGADTQAQLFAVVPAHDLELVRAIGKGNFGVTFEARMHGQTVVVKVPTSVAGQNELAELSVFLRLPKHENVVGFLGLCIDLPVPREQLAQEAEEPTPYDEEVVVDAPPSRAQSPNETTIGLVLEYVPGGDLSRAPFPLAEEVLLRYASDIAAGLQHLHLNGVVHRDVAARNMLVDEHGRVRVTDFGLSRVTVQQESGQASDYLMRMREVLPIRALAPESLRFRVFSPMTDVWMYGVCLWELVTGCTALPYADHSVAEVIDGVAKGELQLDVSEEACPACPVLLRDVIQQCLSREPRDRPTMGRVLELLG